MHKNFHIIPLGGQSNIKQQCHCSWMLTFSDSDVNVTLLTNTRIDFSNNLNKHKIKF